MLLGVRSALAIETNCRCPWLRLEPAVTTNIQISNFAFTPDGEIHEGNLKGSTDLLHERQHRGRQALPRCDLSTEHALMSKVL